MGSIHVQSRQRRGMCRDAWATRWALEAKTDRRQGTPYSHTPPLSWNVEVLVTHRKPRVLLRRPFTFLFSPGGRRTRNQEEPTQSMDIIHEDE